MSIPTIPRDLSKLLTCCSLAVCGMAYEPNRACACGPPYQPELEVNCTMMVMYAAGQQMPANKVDVGVWQSLVSGGGQSRVLYSDAVPLRVWKVVQGGYEEIAFRLESVPDAIDTGDARILIIENMQPSEYVVTWAGGTCEYQPVAPVGDGRLVGSFVVTEAAGAATSLGTLSAYPAEVEHKTFDLGEDSMCRHYEAQGVVVSAPVELTIHSSLQPWAYMTSLAIYVDGAVYRGFANPSNELSDGRYTTILERICATTDDEVFRRYGGDGLSEGYHQVKLVGQIPGMPEIESNTATIYLRCPRTTAFGLGQGDTIQTTEMRLTGNDQEHGSGCSVGADPSDASLWSAAFVLATWYCTRRRRRKSDPQQ